MKVGELRIMQIKYSVIIPVYNAEKTLDRCLQSLLSQNPVDTEIILINDGSTDSSLTICHNYEASYSYVRVIDQINGGVSAARNRGLDEAKGEYILFVDSDDNVSSDYFETISIAVENGKYDMYQFSYTIISSKNEKQRIFSRVKINGRDNLLSEIIKNMCNKRINQPWAKAYKRAIINDNDIRFALGASIAEDREFNIRYSLYIQSYCALDKPIYFVDTRNENSLSRKKPINNAEQAAITHRYFEESLANAPIPDQEKDQYLRAANFASCRYVYHRAKKLHGENLGWLKRQVKLYEMCSDINKQKMKYPNTPFCNLLVLPVRLKLTILIDCLAWKLTH